MPNTFNSMIFEEMRDWVVSVTQRALEEEEKEEEDNID
jgi:hypothetical protein